MFLQKGTAQLPPPLPLIHFFSPVESVEKGAGGEGGGGGVDDNSLLHLCNNVRELMNDTNKVGSKLTAVEFTGHGYLNELLGSSSRSGAHVCVFPSTTTTSHLVVRDMKKREQHVVSFNDGPEAVATAARGAINSH